MNDAVAQLAVPKTGAFKPCIGCACHLASAGQHAAKVRQCVDIAALSAASIGGFCFLQIAPRCQQIPQRGRCVLVAALIGAPKSLLSALQLRAP